MTEEYLTPFFLELSVKPSYCLVIKTNNNNFIFKADTQLDLFLKISGLGLKKEYHYLEQELKDYSTEEIFELLEFTTSEYSKESQEAILPIRNNREAILIHLRRILRDYLCESMDRAEK